MFHTSCSQMKQSWYFFLKSKQKSQKNFFQRMNFHQCCLLTSHPTHFHPNVEESFLHRKNFAVFKNFRETAPFFGACLEQGFLGNPCSPFFLKKKKPPFWLPALLERQGGNGSEPIDEHLSFHFLFGFLGDGSWCRKSMVFEWRESSNEVLLHRYSEEHQRGDRTWLHIRQHQLGNKRRCPQLFAKATYRWNSSCCQQCMRC